VRPGCDVRRFPALRLETAIAQGSQQRIEAGPPWSAARARSCAGERCVRLKPGHVISAAASPVAQITILGSDNSTKGLRSGVPGRGVSRRTVSQPLLWICLGSEGSRANLAD